MTGLARGQDLIDAVDAALGHLLGRLRGEERHVGRVVHVDEGAQVLQLEVGHAGGADDVLVVGHMDDAGLAGEGIHEQCAELAGLHGLGNGVDIHQLAPGVVDEHHAVLHLGDGLAVDHAGGLRQQRGMDGDDVGLTVQGVQIHILGILADGIVLIYVVGQDAAAEAAEALDDGEADLAGAHDAHGHGAQLAAHLALQGKVVVVGVVQRLLELADAHQDGHDGVLRHAVGGVGAVAQAEAQGAGVVAVHVVVTHAAAGQHLHAVALQLIQHLVAVVALAQGGDAVAAGGHVGGGLIQVGGGGDQLDAILLAQVLDNGLLVGTYFVCGDLHGHILLSILREGQPASSNRPRPFFQLLLKSFGTAQSFSLGSMGTASPAAIMAATRSSE